MARAMGGHEKNGKGEAIWLTPPELVKALGPFDLDPCFSEPRPWSTASTMYGPDAAGGLGGLYEGWFGSVWCNPPYGTLAADWLAKCAEHGNCVALIFARTETETFFQEVWRKADGIFFFKGRISFCKPDGTRVKANSGAPSVLIAYGGDAVQRIKNAGLSGQFVDLNLQRKAL